MSEPLAPMACQLVPRLATGPPPILVVPSISQIETWPLTVFCQRMSEFPSWLKSPVPTAFQLGPRLATGPPPILVVPSISQIETWPLTVFCHRMSDFPSWLKSPVPTAFQLGPGLTEPAGPPPIFVVPSISQIEACPFVFCHRMSEFPSWLKSPVPTAFQLGPRLATGPPPILVVPSISQIQVWPLPVFCHRMSEFPSWLKSPVPTAFQLGPGLTEPAGPPPIFVVPSISQIEAWPLTVFCHRMSEFPSWLKSPVPTAFQLGPGLMAPAGPPPIFVLPSISQIDA